MHCFENKSATYVIDPRIHYVFGNDVRDISREKRWFVTSNWDIAMVDQDTIGI